MKISYLIFFLITLSFSVFAQQQWMNFNSTNSPLPPNISNTSYFYITRGRIAVDSVGNFWMGTDSGLYKYDGVFWNHYTVNNSGLPYDNIERIFIDKLNNIWFPIYSSPYPYFVKFDGNHWEKIDTNQTCYTSIDLFAIDRYGTKWIGDSAQRVIIQFDGLNCLYYDRNNIGINPYGFHNMKIDDNDNFCFTSEGENYIPGGIARTSINGWISTEAEWITDFDIDLPNNELWGTRPGSSISSFRRFNYNNFQLIAFYANPQYIDYARFLSIDGNGNVWMHVEDNDPSNYHSGLGVFYRSSENWQVYWRNNSPIQSFKFNGLAIDNENNICIGTVKGITLFNESGLVLPEQLTSNDTLDFCFVLAGSVAIETISICNILSDGLIIDSLEISSQTFYSLTNTPILIPTNDSSMIEFRFNPDAPQKYWGKVTFHTNFGMYVLVLAGEGVSTLNLEELKPIVRYSLFQNNPNPFNPTTKIKYQIPELNFVTLKVYDVLGKEIATLVNQEKPVGNYEIEFDATGFPSGIYFYQLRTGNFIETKKMVLMK